MKHIEHIIAMLQHLGGDFVNPPNQTLADRIRKLSMPQEFADLICRSWPSVPIAVGRWSITDPVGILHDGFLQQSLSEGLLTIGSADNGHPVMIDLHDSSLPVGLRSYEEWHERDSMRKFVAFCFPSFALMLHVADRGWYMPRDYYEARDYESFLASAHAKTLDSILPSKLG